MVESPLPPSALLESPLQLPLALRRLLGRRDADLRRRRMDGVVGHGEGDVRRGLGWRVVALDALEVHHLVRRGRRRVWGVPAGAW